MSTPEEDPQPSKPSSRSETISLLQEAHSEYSFDFQTYGRHLSAVSFIGLIGPAESGNVELLKTIVDLDPEIHPMFSITTSEHRPQNAGAHFKTGIAIDSLKNAIDERAMVAYLVSPTEEVYAASPDQFTAPITIGRIGHETMPHFSNTPFDNFWAVYTLTNGPSYAARLGLDQLNPETLTHNPKLAHRITGSLDSLDFALNNVKHDSGSIVYIESGSDEAEITDSANVIIDMVRKRTRPYMTVDHRIKLIDEMQHVLFKAKDRLGV